MLKFKLFRSFIRYYGSCITVLIAIKVVMHLEIPLYVEEETLGGLAILIGGYVWAENKDSRRKEIEISSGIG
jgi:hypothetical protein